MINVGIVGCGNMAMGYHIPSLQRVKEAKIKAICDKDEKQLEKAIKLVQTTSYYDYNEMLANENLDAVYVLTPPITHKEIVLKALEGDCHIFCEKPPALEVKDVREMCEKAKIYSKVLFFGFNRRFSPLYTKVKEITRIDGIDLLLLEKTREGASFIDENLIRRRCKLHGSMLTSFIVHFIDVAKWICGKVKEVSFHSSYIVNLSVCPGSAAGLIEHQTGAKTLIYFYSQAGKSFERSTMHKNLMTVQTYGGMFEKSKAVITTPESSQIFYSPKDTLERGGFLQETAYFIQMMKRRKHRVFPDDDVAETLELAIKFNDSFGSKECE